MSYKIEKVEEAAAEVEEENKLVGKLLKARQYIRIYTHPLTMQMMIGGVVVESKRTYNVLKSKIRRKVFTICEECGARKIYNDYENFECPRCE